MEKEASDWHTVVFDMYIAADGLCLAAYNCSLAAAPADANNVVKLVGQNTAAAADCSRPADWKTGSDAMPHSSCSAQPAVKLVCLGSCDQRPAPSMWNAHLRHLYFEASRALLPGI